MSIRKLEFQVRNWDWITFAPARRKSPTCARALFGTTGAANRGRQPVRQPVATSTPNASAWLASGWRSDWSEIELERSRAGFAFARCVSGERNRTASNECVASSSARVFARVRFNEKRRPRRSAKAAVGLSVTVNLKASAIKWKLFKVVALSRENLIKI